MEGTDKKMIVLSLDTSTKVSSVAIATEDHLLAELTTETSFTHSETLVLHIEKALCLAGVKREELSAVAISLGPGSFTGLRIGLAAAKAISYALSIPLIGVPTSEVLAAAFAFPGAVVAPLIDAQKGNAYFSIYRQTAHELICEKEIAVASPDAISAAISEIPDSVILSGDFAEKYYTGNTKKPENAVFASFTHRMPRAALVASRGFARMHQGEAKSPMEIEPIYVRRSEAEVLWELRHKENK